MKACIALVFAFVLPLPAMAQQTDWFKQGQDIGSAIGEGLEAARRRAAEEQAARQRQAEAERLRAAAAERERQPRTPASQPSPNMGNKVCGMWSAMRADKEDNMREARLTMEWWLMGYLKGMSDQFTLATQRPSPLIKLKDLEELSWVSSFCQVNQRATIADAAVALLKELSER